MFLACACSAVFFYSNPAFGMDWEQWRIPRDGQDNSGRDEDRADRLQRAAEWRTEQAEETAKQRAAQMAEQRAAQEKQKALKAEQERQKEEKRRADVYALNEKGNAAYQNSDWNAAIDCYQKALKLNPGDKVIQQNLKLAKDSLKQKAMVEAQQKQLENDPAAWSQNQKKLVQQRTKEPNQYCSAICASLKTKAPPLPYKQVAQLKSGDMLLFEPDDVKSKLIRFGDRLGSWEWKSPASHAVIYLKTVDGKKFFLDNKGGEGPHIITEDELQTRYGSRTVYAAAVAQPLNDKEANKLLAAAKELEIKELASEPEKRYNWIDNTNYGLYGDDNLVCSEAGQWVLAKAGRKIPENSSPVKRLLGITFSPADVYSSDYFIITPMDMSK